MTNACRIHRTRIGLATLMASTALCAAPALAQSAPPPDDVSVLGDIIVTAQKREERASETPLSLSVLTGEALQATGATQLADFAATVPGLSFTTNGVGQGQVNLRGVTTGLNVGSTVGIYVDEVPYGSSTSFAGAAQLAPVPGETASRPLEPPLPVPESWRARRGGCALARRRRSARG